VGKSAVRESSDEMLVLVLALGRNASRRAAKEVAVPEWPWRRMAV